MKYGYTRTSTSDKRDDDLLQRARAVIDVIIMLTMLLDRGSGGRSLSDAVDPSTREGKLLLNLRTMFAAYEREPVQERIQAGLDAARQRGVRIGRPPADPDELARKVREVENLVSSEGLSVTKAVKAIGWSRASYYRHAPTFSVRGVLDETSDAH